MVSTETIKYDFKFDTNNVFYDYGFGSWDGTGSSPAKTYFSGAKSNLNWQTQFSQALEQWDQYSILQIDPASAGNGNLYIYSANTVSSSEVAAARTAWFDNATNTTMSPIIDGGYARAEIAFDNNATLQAASPIWAALHETAHALGLKGDHGISTSGGFSTDMTVVSYNVPGTTWNGTDWGGTLTAGRFAVTPMAFDILAIEEKYGSNSLNAENTDYGSLWFTGIKRSFTIQDTGGDDTFDLSGVAGNHRIDLREAIDANGDWSNGNGNPTIIDYNALDVNNAEYVYIAKGTVIENAIGGAESDVIGGNDFANNLNGGAGNDILIGWSGADEFTGGIGDDTIVTGGLSGGSDPIANGQGDILYKNIIHWSEIDGADTIVGFNAIDEVHIDGIFTTLTATSFTYGFVGSDFKMTLASDPTQSITFKYNLFPETGINTNQIKFADGSIFAQAGNANPDFVGGAQNDVFYGSETTAVITGNGGNDLLYGGGSLDTYHISTYDEGLVSIWDETGKLAINGIDLKGEAGLQAENVWRLDGYTMSFEPSSTNLLLTLDSNPDNQILLVDFTSGNFGIVLQEWGTPGLNIEGGYGNDILYGSAGNDNITGDVWYDYENDPPSITGSDTIYGGAGNDYINPDSLYTANGHIPQPV